MAQAKAYGDTAQLLPKIHAYQPIKGGVLADEEILPEVRAVEPGQVLRLCRCGQCASLPDAAADCADVLELTIRRERHLLLCRCGRSAKMPHCDGSHTPVAQGLVGRWRRFSGR
ncbi:CDGSH iron-sulfur domain-containing protein [Pseudomonas nicosulfuronedens]